jgi:hypothetical protein
MISLNVLDWVINKKINSELQSRCLFFIEKT